jgi:hypothetical protein
MSALFAIACRCGLPVLALLSVTTVAQPASASEAPKVFPVVSSEGRLDVADKHEQPGFDLDELAWAWLVLRANGVRVELASPGGAPAVGRYDGRSTARHGPTPAGIRAAASVCSTGSSQGLLDASHRPWLRASPLAD